MGSIKMASQPPPYGATAPPQQGYPQLPQQDFAPPPQQGYGPPPQQGYAPPPQQPQQPVVVQVQHNSAAQPVARTRFDKYPMTMTCPHCQANITTGKSQSCPALNMNITINLRYFFLDVFNIFLVKL